jgi:DNA-binding response OmpR family regulator
MNTPRHILIVDGDAGARDELAREVARHGYSVTQVATAADATSMALFLTARVDLMLIDTDLPDADGRELVSRLRRRGVTAPIIVLSSAGEEDDMVWGLDAGADDYIVRPPRPRELAARIRAQFRVATAPAEGDIRIGPITYRPASRTVYRPGMTRCTRLTEKEAALLLRLCSADGRPVSRQTLLREVWGYSPAVTSHTVETHIYRLRRKIESGSGSPMLLLNEDGGYRLAAGRVMEPEEAAAPFAGWAADRRMGAAAADRRRAVAGVIG